MNKYYKSIIYLFTAMTLVMSSCVDDKLYDDSEIGDGTSKLSVQVSFKSYDSALSRAGGASLDTLNRLTVLVYDAQNESLIGTPHVYEGSELNAITDNSSAPSDAVNPETTTTPRATFNMSLPYGRYKIYAVANADIEGKDVSTPAKLKSISFDWQSDVRKNDQMFGWFSSTNPASNIEAYTFEAPVVLVNKPNVQLNAWLIRLASKITVSYDATKLKENVFIFLKSVEIKDIPKSCALGVTNTPNSEGEIQDGEVIYYYDHEAQPNGPSLSDYVFGRYPACLTSSTSNFGSDHSHGANALFFYENDQKKGKDKAQDAVDNTTINTGDNNYGSGTPDNKIDFPNGNSTTDAGYKDAKPYGTYIEVKAYYISNNPQQQGQGEIVYRFMLGKDKKTSYEALRNYHYKLKLIFNGFANDVDWHIEYDKEDRGINAPNPYYISYLYNHSLMLPLQINTGSATITTLRAEIVSNNWAPLNANQTYAATTLPSANKYMLYWKPSDNPTDYPWNGFLSLRATTQTVINGTAPWVLTSNQSYYESSNRGWVEYTDFRPTTGTQSDMLEQGKLYVQVSNDGTSRQYNIGMPVWTRAKTLIKETGYTGNNPYVAYRREAKIKITATLSDNTVLTTGMSTNPDEKNSELISVQQVRRIVNPKGIYRRGNNNSDFNVELKVLPDEESTNFTTLYSAGPWRAYVFRDTKRGVGNATGWKDVNGTIRLEGNDSTTVGSVSVTDRNGISRTYETIEGKTGSKMAFKVKFNGTTNDNSPNYAIIRVEYQNYSCYHLIFVRQGYGPDAIVGTARWCSANNIAKDKIADSPLDEGSMFRWANINQPIASSNNVNGKSPWIMVTPNDFAKNAAGDNALTLANGAKAKWSDITYTESTSTNSFKGKQTNIHVATKAEYDALYNSVDVEQGFGVAYGDASTACKTSLTDVYGYNSTDTDRGMRGCFVYNYRTGKNMFLPIGASGYGHRRSTLNGYTGVLRYSTSSRWGYFDAVTETYTAGVTGAPLFFDIFRRPGAIYWFRNIDNGKVGWDINYFTFDFSSIATSNLFPSKQSDAVFIRSVMD